MQCVGILQARHTSNGKDIGEALFLNQETIINLTDIDKMEESKMSKYKELEDLFAEWEEAQKDQSRKGLSGKEIKACNTIPTDGVNHIKQDSFSKDGLLDKDAKNIDILFVLKESHVMNSSYRADKNKFWFKEDIVKEAENSGAKNNKYYQRIKTCAEILQNGKLAWKKIAYININKRGGFAATDHKALSKYMDAYGDLIRKQIEIIAPKTIVIMGAAYNTYDPFIKAKILEVDEKSICTEDIQLGGKNKPFRYAHANGPDKFSAELIYMYHPACRFGNYERYFEEIWKKAEKCRLERR